MTYQLEISINLNKVTNLTEKKILLINKAEELGLLDYYILYEFSGKNRQISRNHSVLTLFFPENDEVLNEYIRFVKKKKNINIESIAFDDDGHFKLMYASKKYMSLMEKECVENYLNLKKEKKLYNQNSIIFNSL